MADAIDILLGGGSGPATSTKSLADALRGQQNYGDFLSMSQIPQLAQQGQANRRQATAAAARGGRLRKAAQAREDALSRREVEDEYRAGRDEYRSEQDARANARADEGMSLRRAQAALAQRVAAHKMANPAGKGRALGQKPSASMQKDALGALSLGQQLGESADIYDALTDEQKAEAGNAYKSTLTSMVPTAALQNLAKGALYDDATLNYLATEDRVTSTLTKLASGLAVSGFELKDREKWSPSAAGITGEQRDSRRNIIRSEFARAIHNYNLQYPDFAVQTGEERDQQAQAAADEVIESAESGTAPTDLPLALPDTEVARPDDIALDLWGRMTPEQQRQIAGQE